MEDVERKERRERDKQARAMMQEKPKEPLPLFGEPVRKLSPSDSDRSVQSKLGDFNVASKYIGEKNDDILIGIQSDKPITTRPPVAPSYSGQNNRNPPGYSYPQGQPQQNNRNVFVKPQDNKPLFNGRSSYAVPQANQHISGMSAPKLPPPSIPSSHPPSHALPHPTSHPLSHLPSRPPSHLSSHPPSHLPSHPPLHPPPHLPPIQPPIQQTMFNGRAYEPKPILPPVNGRALPTFAKPTKIVPDRPPLLSSSIETNDVETILHMMTAKLDPLTSIAPTPRTELIETQPHRAPIYAPITPLPPLPPLPSIPNMQTKPIDLLKDLDVSDSDDGGSVIAPVISNNNEDRTKAPTLLEPLSPSNDNSSESGSESSSQESSSDDESNNGSATVENDQEKNKWCLKSFVQAKSTQPSQDSQPPVTNIKHEPNVIDDDIEMMYAAPMQNAIDAMNDMFPQPIVTNSYETKSHLNQNNCDSKVDLIKQEPMVAKSPSKSPEKLLSIESDEIESVLAEAKDFIVKPVSSLSDNDDKIEMRKKKAPKRRPRKQAAANDASSDEDEFSSTNTVGRCKSTDKEKKRRGRPRKDALASAQPKTALNKTAKKTIARTRNGRSNSAVKSREMISTDSSSADEDTPEKPNARLPIASPRNNNKKLTNRNLEELSSEDGTVPPQPTNNLRQESFSPSGRLLTSRNKRSLVSSEESSKTSDDSVHNDQKIDKPNSDKNKKDTLRKVFPKQKFKGGKG
ncbi:hypothetical protein Bhyg_05090, partial [Pseudolycoriella hygida]